MAQDSNKVGVQDATATVGINESTPRWLRKRLVLIAVATLVVAGGVIGGVAIYSRSSTPSAKKAPVSHRVPSGPQAVNQTSGVSYQASEQNLQDQLASEKDTSSKVDTYSQQSALAMQNNQYADAQKYAQNAMQIDPNSPTPYADLALIAQDQHNVAQAKQYWQEAIDHVTPDMPGYNLIKADYQSNLDALR